MGCKTAPVKKTSECTSSTSKSVSPPQLTTRPRRHRDMQADERTDKQTDRQTENETSHHYQTLDDARRENVTYCALTAASDTKRIVDQPIRRNAPPCLSSPTIRFNINSTENDYENIADAISQLTVSTGSGLASSAGDSFPGEKTGGERCPGGKRRFRYRLFGTSRSDTRSLPRRSKSSSPLRYAPSKTLPRSWIDIARQNNRQ